MKRGRVGLNNAWIMASLLVLPLVFLFSVAFQTPSSNADPVMKNIASIPITAKDIETDRLGNLFVVSNSNQLYKFSRDGKPLSTLNYTYQGNISSIDPANPLEVYVFYKELNKVLYLDNNLAYRGETDLTALHIGQASAIARSYDNGLWSFDIADLQLKKMDKNGDNAQASGNIRQYIPNKNVAVSSIFDNTDRVYVNDSVNGVMVFDVFCSYIRTIPLRGSYHIKVLDDDLYYYRDKRINRYNLKNFEQHAFILPDTIDIRDISIEKDRIYILKKDAVKIYSY